MKEIDVKYVLSQLRKIKPFGKKQNPEYANFDTIGVSKLFADVFADIMVFNADCGKYMIFNGEKWVIDNGCTVHLWAKIFAQALYIYITNDNIKVDSEIRKAIDRLLDYNKRCRLVADARLNNFCSEADFVINPYKLKCKNGVYDFTLMAFCENTKDRFALSCDAEFDKDVDYTKWQKFVLDIMNDDKEAAKYLQKVLSLSLIGTNPVDKFWILYGPTTRNGKSTLMNAIAGVMGDYAKNAQASTFEQRTFGRGGSGASEDVARLANARLCVVNELTEGLKLDAAELKKYTGKDKITARFLHAGSFEYTPSFKLFLLCNNLPVISDNSLFISNRVKVIPFLRSYPDNSPEQDRTLADKFATPEFKKQILKWLIDGYSAYLMEGLKEPLVIQQATEVYYKSSDTVSSFIEDELEEVIGSYILGADAYTAYCDYCRASKKMPESKQALFTALYNKGMLLPRKKINNKDYRNVIVDFLLKSEM